MTILHIKNRIKYLKLFLESMPDEQYYMGESDYAEQAVDSENAHNMLLQKEIETEIKRLEKKLKKFKLN